MQRDMIKLFRRNGWEVLRGGKGSHIIVHNKKTGQKESIPKHGCSGMMCRFIKQYGLKA